VPACHPDLGIVHVQAADMHGNARIFGALCTCPEIAQAAVHTIMTCEQVIPTDHIRHYPNLTEIPFPVVNAVVEQPFGATPGACYGYYWFDMPEFIEFRSICETFRKTGDKAGLRDYYDQYIFGCATFDEFLSWKPEETLHALRQKDGGQPILLD